jgi:hypothetical protein
MSESRRYSLDSMGRANVTRALLASQPFSVEGEIPCFARVDRPVRTIRDWFERYSAPLFMVATLLTATTLVSAIVYGVGGTARVVHSIVENVPSLTNSNVVNQQPLTHGKAAFLAKMSGLEGTSVSNQVAFIAEQIRKARKDVDANTIAQAIVTESAKAKYDPLLVTAITRFESTYDRNAVSNKGAVGLMQINPRTAEYVAGMHGMAWHGSWRLFDPAYNVRLGIAYLKYLERYFGGNLRQALVAYNWGPSNLELALGGARGIPAGPADYAEKIISRHKLWNSDFKGS